MEIRQLEYFIASVDEGSFYKAAQKLFTSQPAVSKAIGLLEKDIKAELFERSNRGLKLTGRGEKFYHHAKDVLHQIQMMKRDEVDENIHIRLSTYPSHMISTTLTNFYNAKNGKKGNFELDYREGTVQEIINNVATGISDLGILYISPVQEERFKHILSQNNLEFVAIKESELCVYVGKRHKRYGSKEKITVDELATYKYIRGFRDFFSIEHHFDYVNLHALDKNYFKDEVLTNSDHLVNIMLKNTDLSYLGIDTKVQMVKSKINIDTDIKQLTMGYIKRKLAQLTPLTIELLSFLEKRL